MFLNDLPHFEHPEFLIKVTPSLLGPHWPHRCAEPYAEEEEASREASPCLKRSAQDGQCWSTVSNGSSALFDPIIVLRAPGRFRWVQLIGWPWYSIQSVISNPPGVLPTASSLLSYSPFKATPDLRLQLLKYLKPAGLCSCVYFLSCQNQTTWFGR